MTPAQAEWQRCRPWIEAAIAQSPGLESIEDVERCIQDGSYVFWPGTRSAAVTEIQEYAQRKVLAVIHGGGDLDELLDEMEPVFVEYAHASGCDGVVGMGRKGWERAALRRGYRYGFVTMIKDIFS